MSRIRRAVMREIHQTEQRGYMRLIQLSGAGSRRAVCLVADNKLQRLNEQTSVYDLALAALAGGVSLRQAVEQRLSDEHLDYEEIYQGRSEWRILPSVDHPQEPARCYVTGTG